MKKLLTLRAIQVLHGDKAVLEEILRALKKTNGNMREACALLGLGRSSMYRLIEELAGAREAVDALCKENGWKIQGKQFERDIESDAAPAPPAKVSKAPPAKAPAPAVRQRVRTRSAAAATRPVATPAKSRARAAEARR